MKKTIIFSTIAAAMTLSANAAAKPEANDSLVRNYMRSSLYTIILNSDKMNAYYEEESQKTDASATMALIKGFSKADSKKAANDTVDTDISLFELPARVFTDIEIPNQFNDHNLGTRILDFDAIKATVTDEDVSAAAEKFGQTAKKKGGFGKFAKGMMGMSTKGNDNNQEFDKVVPGVMYKFFEQDHVAPNLIAKWYDYNPDGEKHWGLGTIMDRGNYNFSKEELAKAKDDINIQNKIAWTSQQMIGNTYVLAVNLRFRSHQAIVAEAAALAKAAGSKLGSLGALAADVASAGASAATGDGYTVQAVTYLYRLKWSDDLNQKFGVDFYGKQSTTLEDLINSGLCELEFVGSEKSSSNIRQRLLSGKPIRSLIKRATARAIDEAIIKLQNSHEEFRTVLPILGGDGTNIYAAIGTKEGLNEKDEYEILEAQEKENGEITYKAVGTVKAVKGKIMDNAYGAAEDLEDASVSEEEKAAINRSYSEFKGKKGDYTGYYLRLKKKN